MDRLGIGLCSKHWVTQHGLFQFVPTGSYCKPLQLSTCTQLS